MSIVFENSNFLSEEQSRSLFSKLLIFSQVTGVLAFLSSAYWMGNFDDGGYGWNDDPEKQFHYHPTFMTMGFIFMYGESIIIYRALRSEPKRITKLAHLCIHTVVIIFVLVAIKAVLDSHNYHKDSDGNLDPIPNYVSLHSWIGGTIVLSYIAQYIVGFYTYFIPGARQSTRQYLMPFHQLFGLIIFIIVCINALVGISERAAWKHTCWTRDKEFCGKQVLSNFLGIFIICYCVSVVIIILNPRWKRRPLPEEETLHRLSELD
ncbi:Cytochrome b561, eukaryote domain and Cytochrome b561/ferric reductase transmembrane domain-containing protein [Strongyloides ratti]|uniref:Cytochrome b561, eukaryote domain and Cytochrome b561/ferric reductase transmembrane domain-containing protein n=1 Tax=Strongyloides ratti TaxID=34506 RepID=A0A090LKD5_STRRB|nr:Cytochrome b561, eukaryote domain and Cytochrome b561/ferric reductase transmembrane domain-containing protein [Strongyloides ratti]CEF68020.1 Cytochrome b561, eukaryote domain and Cytochrome b561/ferric reductase transmembrane domain-containing protein [Strongyloides ratti]